ncbi:2-oxoacid:acceptor oxidoreductase subunit alpha [Candidatus Peribacteria bacterium]|nr:MAG: 2-oxoacid:acceptor oxidoreductase subunit alpha [Candidatus Peribacteria bacterium]
MSRLSLKIVGASGQGIISIGEILAKAFKRSGYCVFGYREYMSLIKGGHGSYQIDVSDHLIQSSEEQVDVLITLNHHGFEHNLMDLKEGGTIIHDTKVWKFSKADEALLKKQKVQVVYLPIHQMLQKMQAKPILANVIFSSFIWCAVGGDIKLLKSLVGERFASKKDLLEMNMRCIDEGFAVCTESGCTLSVALPKPDKKWKDQLLLTGSQAMGLGIVHAGCRFYAGYPMTPSSPLLSYIAEIQNETGMAIKQAEDEITAAQMMSGAMHMGTRAITATSGGGFDLMTETISMDAMIENPAVIVLAQRPGPATGLPTWTAQGDLLMAVHSAHGEFARCVLSVSDAEDAFHLMPKAFNIAEEFQTPVIVLTDKHTAEGIYTQKAYDQKKAKIVRGKLVTASADLKKLKSSDRYDPTAKDGISKRWLPGANAATYCAQGDEHSPDGSVSESADNAVAQMEKRMRKAAVLKNVLPEPEFFYGDTMPEPGNAKLDLLIVSWGSNKGVMLDVLNDPSLTKKKVGYLHYTYLWPLKTEMYEELTKKAKRVLFIECSYQAQLLQLLRMQCGTQESNVLLKYDGRPFFYYELLQAVHQYLSK